MSLLGQPPLASGGLLAWDGWVVQIEPSLDPLHPPVEAVQARLQTHEIIAQVREVDPSAGYLPLERPEALLYLAQILAKRIRLFVEAAQIHQDKVFGFVSHGVPTIGGRTHVAYPFSITQSASRTSPRLGRVAISGAVSSVMTLPKCPVSAR